MDELEGWEWGRDSVGARRFGSAIDNTDVDAGRATAAACAGDIKSDPVPDSNVNEGPRTAPIKTAAPLSAAVATNRGSVGGKRLSITSQRAHFDGFYSRLQHMQHAHNRAQIKRSTPLPPAFYVC